MSPANHQYISNIDDTELLESFVLPQGINSLPVKRIYNSRTQRLRELVKLTQDLQCSANEILLKVKLVGINYHQDFNISNQVASIPIPSSNHLIPTHAHANNNPHFIPKSSSIVPGFRILGKIQEPTLTTKASSSTSGNSQKYILFPFSNCILQNERQLCHQCKFLITKGGSILNSQTYSLHSRHQCLKNFVHGYTIDGGLQDYIKVKDPENTLVKVPSNVSLHDALFVFDIMLPFYSFVKYHLNVLISGKVLVILNDITKELNDILIILSHFNVDQANVSILDSKMINSYNANEETNHHKFDQIFIFDESVTNNKKNANTNAIVNFLKSHSPSSGLESTKSRYNIVLFNNQYHVSTTYPQQSLNYLVNNNNNDKTFHQFKLSYKDKIHLEEVLLILSNLNTTFKSSSNPNSIASPSSIKPRISIDSISSSISSNSQSSANSFASSTMSFHESHAHLIDKSSSSSSSPSASSARSSSTQHWIHCDYDFDLIKHDDVVSDDEENADYDDDDTTMLGIEEFIGIPKRSLIKKSHSIKEMNKLIRTTPPNSLTRVCYNVKSNKPTKLNAFVF
ncbi:uncharacterized protein RJT21DRAFT_87884 [Scheffersomyces amazonensis]|uniref:uncharacterized protein n=1 Tax=Scheffersomyces amazonensis TaxID=1078765 RepID=UPI00315D027F